MPIKLHKPGLGSSGDDSPQDEALSSDYFTFDPPQVQFNFATLSAQPPAATSVPTGAPVVEVTSVNEPVSAVAVHSDIVGPANAEHSSAAIIGPADFAHSSAATLGPVMHDYHLV